MSATSGSGALVDQIEPRPATAATRRLVRRRLHAAFWDAADNPLLTARPELRDRADRYRRQSLDQLRGSGTRRTADFEQHFELMALVFAGESDRAAELMHRHVEHSLPGDPLNPFEPDADGSVLRRGA